MLESMAQVIGGINGRAQVASQRSRIRHICNFIAIDPVSPAAAAATGWREGG